MIKVKRDARSLKDNLYIIEVLKGLAITFRHMFSNLLNLRKMPVIDYPNQEKGIPKGYRGKHRLTKRENGEPKCVACMMCATACPANCIHIEANESPDPTVEKYPARFDIDLLECVFCGMCVEACPVDAIRMDSGIYSIVDFNRSDFVVTKEQLLATEPQDTKKQKLDIKDPRNPWNRL
ncbi:MAG: NADH-quinone oxidoreductase subunit I 1 [Candidatus Sericytochromatia bacterium]|nr:MAG: NADH-quinone oxidoreductase subunit I 1 [Candidatus Sericytochromatia bacterium]